MPFSLVCITYLTGKFTKVSRIYLEMTLVTSKEISLFMGKKVWCGGLFAIWSKCVMDSLSPGRYLKKNWVCGPLPKTLTLFLTKSAIFLTPLMTWPKIRFSASERCDCHSCAKHKLWNYEYEKVASSQKDQTVKSLPYLWPKRLKTTPFGAADTYITHIKDYPTGLYL